MFSYEFVIFSTIVNSATRLDSVRLSINPNSFKVASRYGILSRMSFRDTPLQRLKSIAANPASITALAEANI